jgi:hypothetical protein
MTDTDLLFCLVSVVLFGIRKRFCVTVEEVCNLTEFIGLLNELETAVYI